MTGYDSRGQRRAVPETWATIAARIWRRDNHVCQVCGQGIPSCYYHCGHIVDRMCGGSDEDDNLVVMCNACNMGKPPHETREEYAAWVAAGGYFGEVEQRMRDPIAALWAKASEEERERLLQFSKRMADEAEAHYARLFAKEARAAALTWRRHVGCNLKVGGRRDNQQVIIEALWRAGRRGLRVCEMGHLAPEGVRFSTIRLLIKRGEIMEQRSLFGGLLESRCFAAMPAPPPPPELPPEPIGSPDLPMLPMAAD
jgi:hypothetical protein